MKINWKVRLKNKAFWLAAIPAMLLLASQVAALFGYTLDLAGLSDKLVGLVGTVFGLLSVLGIVVDPTTEGFCDSCNALEYEAPKAKEV